MSTLDRHIDLLIDEALDDAFEESLASYDINDPFSYEGEVFPVDIIEFAESKEFLGLKGSIYKEVKNLLIDIEEDSVREADLILGKGSGKSMLAQIFTGYGLYRAIQLKEPQRTFGLTWNTALYSINVSISRQQAEDVIFNQTKDLLEASPYFKPLIKASNSKEMEFIKRVHMLCGHSGSTAFLGYATMRAVMDECNFMVDNNNRSVASDLYAALVGSLRTRFPKDYKLLCISSDSTPNSFLRESINSVKQAIDNERRKVPTGL